MQRTTEFSRTANHSASVANSHDTAVAEIGTGRSRFVTATTTPGTTISIIWPSGTESRENPSRSESTFHCSNSIS